MNFFLLFYFAVDRLKEEDGKVKTGNGDISQTRFIGYEQKKKKVEIGGVYTLLIRDIDFFAQYYRPSYLSSNLPRNIMPSVQGGGILKRSIPEVARKNRCIDFRDTSQRIAECRLRTKYHTFIRRVLKPLGQSSGVTLPWLHA